MRTGSSRRKRRDDNMAENGYVRENVEDPRYNYIDERGIDITDSKWAHPELVRWWNFGNDNTKMAYTFLSPLNDPAMGEQLYEGLAAQMLGKNGRKSEREYPNGVTMKAFTGHGCPEEPETDVLVEVHFPKGYDPSVKHPVVFHPVGGAVYMNFTSIFPMEQWCENLNMPFVSPIHRSSLVAKYPAAINDNHAAWLWMVEHADELGFDTDRVVIFGNSTGGHLAACLAFRLKRYGWPGGMPRGVVAYQPQLDDSTNYHSCQYRIDNYDGEQHRWAAATYLGIENLGNPNLGPEAYANRATVEDCKGLCPFFIHGGSMDLDVQAELEFVNKLIQNDVYVQYMLWGGHSHGNLQYASLAPIEGVPGSGYDNGFTDTTPRKRPEEGYSIIDRFVAERRGEILDCVRYDFRRPWLMEE